MDELMYRMIFKRKSFHIFKGELKLSGEVLREINNQILNLRPLTEGIRTEWRIVPRDETTCTRGEYCVLLYSEKKDYYLYNAGYMMQQLDLWLASQNIGACWYGIGRTKEKTYQGLDFVIMLAIEKEDETDFRRDYTKTKRKDLTEIWQGDCFCEIADVVRFAPSACNTQPWCVRADPDKLEVYRVLGKRGIMPAARVFYYNKIDMGIFILITELCLKHENIPYTTALLSDADEGQENLVARIVPGDALSVKENCDDT